MTGLDILEQMLSPTLIIELFCASPGQDSFVQSRIPLRKAELEHKQTTSVVSLQPSEAAFPSMLVIQNCYRWTSVKKKHMARIGTIMLHLRHMEGGLQSAMRVRQYPVQETGWRRERRQQLSTSS